MDRKGKLGLRGPRIRLRRFFLHLVLDVKTWVAQEGLLKAEIGYGSTPYADSTGNIVDTLRMQERYELLRLNQTASVPAAAKPKYKSISVERLP